MKSKNDLALAWAVKARAKGIKVRPVQDELLEDITEETLPIDEHLDDATVEAAAPSQPTESAVSSIIRKIRARKVQHEDRELEGLESDN